MLGDNLPPATEVVSLYNHYNIRRMRIYDPNPDALRALNGSRIDLIVGVPNDQLQGIAINHGAADSWVQTNILNHLHGVRFRYIAVGNEITPTSPFAKFLYPAMVNIQNSISRHPAAKHIKVSSAFIYGVIGVSYPPSQGQFNKDYWPIVEPILKFLIKNRSPLLLNVYPFFAYFFNPGQVRLDYALFTAPAGLVPDPPLGYGNLFDAMVDAAYSALEKAGAGDLTIVVAETGWTTAGAGNATTVENARLYNNNLVKHVERGTPKRPGKEIETYLFGLFDEDLKSPETEKHWGLFTPDKKHKYPINFRT
ncbi:Glucan endo-1,3-beta-glucosidase, basic isoform [Linum perenne]